MQFLSSQLSNPFSSSLSLIITSDFKKYTIDIPENVTPKEAPFMMSLFLKKGIRTMNSDWSMRWVQSRIIPSSRQNIGEILRVNGMRSYDEHKLLLKNEGRSCQDEFYIEHM